MEDIFAQLTKLIEDSVPPRRPIPKQIPNIEEVDWDAVAKTIGTEAFFPSLDEIWGTYKTYQNCLEDYYRQNQDRGDAD